MKRYYTINLLWTNIVNNEKIFQIPQKKYETFYQALEASYDFFIEKDLNKKLSNFKFEINQTFVRHPPACTIFIFDKEDFLFFYNTFTDGQVLKVKPVKTLFNEFIMAALTCNELADYCYYLANELALEREKRLSNTKSKKDLK
jgi:hypothetical protein